MVNFLVIDLIILTSIPRTLPEMACIWHAADCRYCRGHYPSTHRSQRQIKWNLQDGNTVTQKTRQTHLGVFQHLAFLQILLSREYTTVLETWPRWLQNHIFCNHRLL